MSLYNPISDIYKAAELVNGGPLNCDVVYSDKIRRRFGLFGCWGITIFPDDGSRPEVVISTHLKMNDVLEIIAHELAHVIVGMDNGHGKKWEEAFDRISRKYAELIDEKSGKEKSSAYIKETKEYLRDEEIRREMKEL